MPRVFLPRVQPSRHSYHYLNLVPDIFLKLAALTLVRESFLVMDLR
jgi:hypothetical protein